jgi:3-hydroxyacyl-CoA dehydrogenase/3a,7a,12a-trihydroxy-5b-cholest-24-enoyl-CoA hydratase
LNEQGEEIARNQSSVFIRGIGGFGGERGPSGKINLPPDRPPDAVQAEKSTANQALLYRLSSGDNNPLHVDPAMAAIGGFDRPILHGLCTFGFAGRAILKQFCHNDPSRLKSLKVRFNKHVFPGETIVTEMWRETETRIVFQSKVAERDEIVLSNAAAELFPVPEPAQGSERGAAGGDAPGSQSRVIFDQINQRIAEHPEWVDRVGAVFQFNIAGEDGGHFVVDLKNDGGGARPGEDASAGCVLTVTLPDFVAMTRGELNPQAAFMTGKLKVSGNVMLAAKLAMLFS